MSKPAFPRLHKAIKVAVRAHKKQDRDGDDPLPYVTHPLEVLGLARFEGGVLDEDVLCAAVLHDLFEETEVSEREIEKEFGVAVLALVKELTREEPDEAARLLPEPQLWQVRNDAMMAEIDRMSESAKLLKLADRCSNLASALRTRTGEKLDRYVRQSKQILEHIDRAVCPALWDRINRMVSDHDTMVKPRRRNLRGDASGSSAVSG